MTEAEYAKLVNSYGEDGAKELVEILDNYKASSGKRYKDDYRAILNWCVDKYLKRNNNLYGSAKINSIMLQLQKQWNVTMRRDFDDLTDETVFKQHGNLLCTCGNVVLAKQFKRFVIDDNNRDIIHFLLYYFNNCKKAEDVFPGKGYTIHKNLMICGEVGVGKTMLMQVFADYLKRTGNPNAFVNLSVTQMINYYKMHNHLDKYTYNEDGTQSFEGKPFNVCLNDVGLQTHLHFGTDTKVLVTDFFHARNEIWAQQGKFAHITTNLTASELKEYFADGYGRLEDRFKTYNVIHLKGKSRR